MGNFGKKTDYKFRHSFPKRHKGDVSFTGPLSLLSFSTCNRQSSLFGFGVPHGCSLEEEDRKKTQSDLTLCDRKS